jgi:prepilin-type N-terminal cleavage/methylation domain-containing protein/prepilin-type processing-associated H-X9-DG protein
MTRSTAERERHGARTDQVGWFPRSGALTYMDGGPRGPVSRVDGRSAQRGFTLIELLVVIAIIGILVSLLLPAVQAAREAGRRIQCQNQIKQLGLAVQVYHDQFQQFPASGIVAPSSTYYDPATGPQFSWLVLILPQMEQVALHDQFDFRLTVFQQVRQPQAARLATLVCPSDSASDRTFVHPTLTQGVRFAKGNYAAYVSPYHVELQNRFPGVLVGQKQRMASITDGTSNTLLAAEVLTRGHEQDQRGVWALPWNGSSQIAFDMHDRRNPVDFTESGYDPVELGAAQSPNRQLTWGDRLYDCPDPVGALLEKLPCSLGAPADFLSAATRSRHPGGVNTVFADGHVGFLPDTVDTMVMAYLISIHDGHPVSVADHVR